MLGGFLHENHSYIPDCTGTLFSPHYILIRLTFLDWFSARTSAKLLITFACFAVNVEEIRS